MIICYLRGKGVLVLTLMALAAPGLRLCAAVFECGSDGIGLSSTRGFSSVSLGFRASEN